MRRDDDGRPTQFDSLSTPGDISFTFNGGRGFPGWIWAELRREAMVECAVCAAAMMDAMLVRRRVSESGMRLRAFGY